MSLTIRPVENAGDLERERLILRATNDLDIGDYAVFMAEANGDSVSSGPVQAYWFPDQKIKAGDFVVLYSKKGVRSEKKGDHGSTSYFFYWGWSSAKWVGNKRPVVLLSASWDTAADANQQKPPTSQAR